MTNATNYCQSIEFVLNIERLQQTKHTKEEKKHNSAIRMKDILTGLAGQELRRCSSTSQLTIDLLSKWFFNYRVIE